MSTENAVSSELASISSQYRNLLTSVIEERVKFIGGLPTCYDHCFVFTSGPIATNECLPFTSFPIFIVFSLPSGGLFGSTDPASSKQVTNTNETLQQMLSMRFISAGIELFTTFHLSNLNAINYAETVFVKPLKTLLKQVTSPWVEFPLPFLPKDLTLLAGNRTSFASFVKQLVSELDSRSSGLFSAKKYEVIGLDMIKRAINAFEVDNESFELVNRSTLSLESLFSSFHGIVKGLYHYYFPRSELLNATLLLDLFVEKKIFPKGFADKVKESFQSLLGLRLSCHHFYRSSCEVVYLSEVKEDTIAPSTNARDATQHLKSCLYLTHSQKTSLANILRVVSALIICAKAFLKTKDTSSFI
jgi:hypothetical protein